MYYAQAQLEVPSLTFAPQAATKDSVWEKPEGVILLSVSDGNAEYHSVALKTPFEVCSRPYIPLIAWLNVLQRALAQTPWKEYFQQGRKFYYNVRVTQDKVSIAHPLADDHKGIQMGNA